jgi:hypothetical protein
MPTASPNQISRPQVREAFDEACRALLEIHSELPSVRGAPHVLFLPAFATQFQQLRALPRRTRRALRRRWKCALSVIALSMTLGQVPVWAATIEVAANTPPSIARDGKCSLIEAIVNANRDARTHLDCVAGAGADTIILPELSQQALKAREILPNIWSKIVIEGHGSTIRRDAALDYSPLDVDFFRITAAGDLTLNETTISGETAITPVGWPSGAPSGYAGIRNAGGIVTLRDSSIRDLLQGLANTGTATLTNSTVSGNGNTYFGGANAGGIFNGGYNQGNGTMFLRNCIVTGNTPGIVNRPDATLTLSDSTVSGNFADQSMGGGLSNGGTALIVRSTFSENWAYWGGGIFNGRTGIATLIRSTVSGNAANYGGGIANRGSFKLTNSTVSNNRAGHHGGGLLADYSETNQSALILASSTVTGNYAGYDGGGLFFGYGTVTLQRSIVSGNSLRADSAGREISNRNSSDGVVIGDDYNLIGHSGDAGALGFTPGSTDIVPSKPTGGILRPLADNGGGTHTHALAIGSPALNASPDDETCPAIDQRGNPRPRGAACDIGAFEGSAVLCGGKVTTQVGTVGADDLTGTPGADVISGLTGGDVIVGLDGNDVICAGPGPDQIYGGIGNDVLFGEPGNDRLFGQRGDDKLDGGPDQDYCDGGSQTGAGDTATACETVIGVP